MSVGAAVEGRCSHCGEERLAVTLMPYVGTEFVRSVTYCRACRRIQPEDMPK